jgi:predicted DNA-binding transcriptional regulator AlpA
MSALQDFPKLPDTAGVRLPTVCALLGVGPATVWRWSRANTNGFPSAKKLSPRVTVWSAGQLRQYMQKAGL